MTASLDTLLRPRTLSDVIGLEQQKVVLNTVLTAAKAQRQPLGHILLSGPPGTGKTTLAHVIANEMAVPCWATTGTNLATQLSDQKTLTEEILPMVEQGGVIFCDEIHRVANLMQDALLPWLERNELAVRYRALRAGVGVRKGDWVAVNITTRPCTFIGATTRSGLLQEPFRERFKLELNLDYYGNNAMYQIVQRSAWLLELMISNAALWEVAKRSKGVPRNANRHLWYCRQYQIAHKYQYIDTPQAREIMQELGIDALGLDKVDRTLLKCLADFNMPMGAITLCAYLSIDRATLEDILEPYLLRAKLIAKTSRGRIITPLAIEHLKNPFDK